MAAGGSAARQTPTHEQKAITQSILDKIRQSAGVAERFQRDWAAGIGNGSYASYDHQDYMLIEATYKGRKIGIWPMECLTKPTNKVLTMQELSGAGGKALGQWFGVAMLGGKVHFLVGPEKTGTYRDLDMSLDNLVNYFPVDLNALRCMLDGLAKPPKKVAGEQKWPDEVETYGK